jgi:membrane-associated phospholipid phosphatase
MQQGRPSLRASLRARAPRALTRQAWIAVAVTLASTSAKAGERQDLSGGWPADWMRIGPAEGAVIGGLATSAIALQLLLRGPSSPRWDRPILFDDGVRNALRASSPEARSRAAGWSDVGYYGLPLYPIVVDAGLVAWLGRGKSDAALQLALINAEALAINGLLTTILQRSIGRARPFVRACATDPRPECSDEDRNTAFVSGHASMAFTAASALCVQHARLNLYGSADAIVCPAALAIAATTGVLRIVADRHWATDVLAGAALGATVGTIVSSLHLRSDGVASTAGLSLPLAGRGIAYGGRF